MALIKLRSMKGQLMTLSMLIILVLMLAALFSFALLDVNSNSAAQLSASTLTSNNYAKALSLSAQSFASSSESAALSTLIGYESNPNLRDDNFINNFSYYMQSLIVSGTLPNVSVKSTAGNFIAAGMQNFTLDNYNLAIAKVFDISSRSVSVNDSNIQLFQSTPYTLSLSYTEGIAINSSGNIYTYSIPVTSTISLNNTQDLFYAQQGVTSYMKFASLNNQTKLIGNSYAVYGSNTFIYGTIYKLPSGVTCATITSDIPSNLQSSQYETMIILVTPNALGITGGGCTADNSYGGLITYNGVTSTPTVPYLVYSSSSNIIANLQTGSKVLLYGPGLDTLDITNLKNSVANGYYFASPYASSYMSRAQGIFNVPSTSGIFTFSNYNKQGANFNGNGYINLNSITPGSTQAVSAWVFPTSTPARQEILNSGGTYFNLQNGDVCIYLNGVNSQYLCSSTTVSTNTWSFVSATFNGKTEIVYINGQASNTLAITGTPSSMGGGAIGRCFYCSNVYDFNGIISNVQLYNTSLSPAQIGYEYQQGISALPLNNGGLTGYWILNGNANDYSGNGNNGIAFGIIYAELPSYSVDSTLMSPSSSTKVNPIPGILSCSTSSQCSNMALPHLYLSYSQLSPQGGFEVASFNSLHSSTISGATASNQINSFSGNYNTVSFWMYWTGPVSSLGITAQMPFGFNQYDLDIPSSSCFGFNTGNGDTYGINPSSLLNKWSFITAVFYNGAYTGNNKLYVNGAVQTLTQCLGSANSGSATNTFHLVGWGVNNNYFIFNGSISDLQIYNTSLTSTQVQNLYKEGINGVPTNAPQNLAVWWPLNGDANDYSGNGNNGTISSVVFPYFYGNYSSPVSSGAVVTTSANEWQILGLGST